MVGPNRLMNKWNGQLGAKLTWMKDKNQQKVSYRRNKTLIRTRKPIDQWWSLKHVADRKTPKKFSSPPYRLSRPQSGEHKHRVLSLGLLKFGIHVEYDTYSLLFALTYINAHPWIEFHLPGEDTNENVFGLICISATLLLLQTLSFTVWWSMTAYGRDSPYVFILDSNHWMLFQELSTNSLWKILAVR